MDRMGQGHPGCEVLQVERERAEAEVEEEAVLAAVQAGEIYWP